MRLIPALTAACALVVWGATAQARSLKEIRHAGTLIVCANSKAMPISGNEEAPGFQVEIVQEIAKDIGVRLNIEWIWASYQTRYTDCDMTLGVARDPKPGGFMRYMQAISDVEILLAYSDPHRQPTPEGLRDQVVAVPSASLAHFKLLDLGADPRVAYKSEPQILDGIVSGALDAGVVSSVALNWYRHAHPDQPLYSVSTDILDVPSRYPMTIGLRKTDSLGEADFQDILANLRADGRLEVILSRYGQKLSAEFDNPYAKVPDAVSERPSSTVRKDIVEELEQRVRDRRLRLDAEAAD